VEKRIGWILGDPLTIFLFLSVAPVVCLKPYFLGGAFLLAFFFFFDIACPISFYMYIFLRLSLLPQDRRLILANAAKNPWVAERNQQRTSQNLWETTSLNTPDRLHFEAQLDWIQRLENKVSLMGGERLLPARHSYRLFA